MDAQELHDQVKHRQAHSYGIFLENVEKLADPYIN